MLVPVKPRCPNDCAENCSPALASGVTERIWACVSLQWEWLGGAQDASLAPGDEAPRREISRAA